WRGTQCLDRRLVHEPVVQRGYLGRVAASGGVASFVAFHQLAHAFLGQVAQHQERAVAGTIGRDLGRVGPVATDIAEEVRARVDFRIHARGIDSPGAVPGGVLGKGNRRGKQGEGRGSGGGKQGLLQAGSPVRINGIHHWRSSHTGRATRASRKRMASAVSATRSGCSRTTVPKVSAVPSRLAASYSARARAW